MHDLPDEQLLDRWRSSSEEERGRLLGMLFERYYTNVALCCLRWSGNRDHASDLAQETFAKVFRNLDSFQDSSKFRTWLYTISRNHCWNAAETNKSSETSELDDLMLATIASNTLSPETQTGRNEALQLARQMMEESLDETERKVILLHHCDELPLPMVTRVLGLTNASGAKDHLVSAHRKLKTAVLRWKTRQPAPG